MYLTIWISMCSKFNYEINLSGNGRGGCRNERANCEKGQGKYAAGHFTRLHFFNLLRH